MRSFYRIAAPPKKKVEKSNEKDSEKEEEKEEEDKNKIKTKKRGEKQNETSEEENSEESEEEHKIKKKTGKKKRKKDNDDSDSEEKIKEKPVKKKGKNRKIKTEKGAIDEENSEESEEESKIRKKTGKKKRKKDSDDSDSEEKIKEKTVKNKKKGKNRKIKTEKEDKEEDETETCSNLFAAPLQISNIITPQGKDLANLTYQKLISLIGEYLKVFFKYGSFFPEFLKKENIDLIKKYISKYNLFFNIKRFSIPCFGTISCGKSTFINYLLKLHNILEADEDIATKFVCIIRHNKDLKEPKIYTVKFEQRDIGKFNFEKNKQLKGDVKEIIKKRNKFIKEGNGKREPSNYFLIVEVDIPLFHGENEKYSPFFEFLDFPGLDEVKEGENTIRENTYFKDFLPLVQPNIIFSLFLFDLNSYESNSGKDILKNYISNKDDMGEYMNKKLRESFYRSVYILNQIDKELKEEKNPEKREEMKEKKENYFREKMKQNFSEILKIYDLQFNEENSLGISAKILELNEYKYESFPNFINYINSLEELEEENNYKNYLEKKMKEAFNIKIKKNNENKEENNENKEENNEENDEEEEEDEEVIENELDEINEKLSNISKVGNYFKLKDYIFYRKLFNKNINKVNDKEIQDDDIKALILNKIKKCFEDFFNLEEFSKILTYIDNNSKELVEYSKKMENNLLNLSQNPNSIEYPLTILESIDALFDKFLILSQKSGTIRKLKNNSEIFLNYVKNQLTMRFIFLGRHNSGKTSLINSFLGINILETSAKECTMAGFVIKHIENIEETQIFEGKLEKNAFGYYYFKKANSLAKGVDKVKEKIQNLNKKGSESQTQENNNNKNLNFYIIEIPINIFKNIGIGQEIYSKIELIDIPGLDTGLGEAINSSNNLLEFTDGFIFVNNGKQLDNNDNRVIIKRIIERISKRPQFSFNTCLFVLTRADECRIKIEESKEQIQKILAEGFESKSFAEIIKDNKTIKNKNNLLVSPFSNLCYKEYLSKIKELENFEFLEKKDLKKIIKKLKEEYIEMDKKEFEDYKSANQINEKDDNYQKIISILKDKFEFSEEKISENKENIINIIYISSYILKNNKKMVKYRGSKAEDLFKEFNEEIKNAYKIYQENLKILSINFFLRI